MLGSGSRSYYDDYVRKKGTSSSSGAGGNRLSQDPPALMTDRGAYVNFLEVQLERVSAACLSVQSYDQRFNDTQNMLAHLEEKIGTLTKLIALSQECTQQIKQESDTKLEKMSKSISDEQSQSFRSLQAMSERVTSVENSLTTLYGLFPRMESMEHRLDTGLSAMKANDRKFEESISQSRTDVDKVLADRRDFLQRFEKVELVSAQAVSDYQEVEKRVFSLITGVSDRTTDVMNQQREELALRIQSLDNKVRFDSEKIDAELASRDLALKSTLLSMKDSVNDELRKFEIGMDRKISAELSKSASDTLDRIGNLTRDTEELQSKFYDLEKESAQQFQLIDETIGRIDDSFQAILGKSLVERLDAIEAEHRAFLPIVDSMKEGPFYGKSGDEVDLWMQNKVADLLPSAEKKPGNILRSSSASSARDNMIVPTNRDRAESNSCISRADLSSSTSAGNNEGLSKSINIINSNMPELLSKFLDAYQCEQAEIKRKLDSLIKPIHSSSSSSSPERFRGQGQGQLGRSSSNNNSSSFIGSSNNPNANPSANANVTFSTNNNNDINNNTSNSNNSNNSNNLVSSNSSNNATIVRQSRYLLPYFSRVWVPNNTSSMRSSRANDFNMNSSSSSSSSSSLHRGSSSASDPLSYPPLNRNRSTSPNATASNTVASSSNYNNKNNNNNSNKSDNLALCVDNVSEVSTTVSQSRPNTAGNATGGGRINTGYHRDHLVGSAAKVEKNRFAY